MVDPTPILPTMSEAENVFPLLQDKETNENPFDMLLNEKSTLRSDNLANNLTEANDSTDDENKVPLTGVRRKIKRFSDSDSEDEADKENILIKNQASSGEVTSKPNVSSESEDDIFPRKSRLRDNSDSSDNDNNKSPNYEESRIGNKRNKLHEKFKGLLNSRSRAPEIQKDKSPCKSSADNGNNSSDSSSSGIESIKKKIKQKSMLLKSGICDPDTSSDEESNQQRKQMKKKPKPRSTILTSPKPARMSAKQAMENMQKIKSESNRMLREKEVTLPYHRSKALSLKDIMSRRKPALSADGKALPVKMNSDQLKQYVKLLEQRNKEMMELCKSDTEEDEPMENSEKSNLQLNDGDVKESSNNCRSVDQNMEDTELPYVDILKKTNEDDLPDLTVEIIQKELEKSSTVVEIVQKEQEESSTDLIVVEKDQKKSSTDVKMIQEEQDKSTTDVRIVKNEQEKSTTDVEIVQKEQDTSTTDVEIVQNEQEKSTTDVEIVEKEQHNLNDVAGNNDINLKDITAAIHLQSKTAAEDESQMIELHYETEKTNDSEPLHNLNSVEMALASDETANVNIENDKQSNEEQENTEDNANEPKSDKSQEFNDSFSDDFSDVDINMEDLEVIIENAKKATSAEDAVSSPMLIRDPHTLNMKPILTGAPGMVIDLDGSNPIGPRKLTGVELLKERFTYFAKLKTPEEKERERELKIKPGMQHFKLKQELEEQISEQRSLEWAKRLAEEKQQQMEMDAVRGDETDEDDIEKIEAKLEAKENEKQDNMSSESEEEDIPETKDKPRKRNEMIDDEAEVSGEDEDEVSDSELTEEQHEEEEVVKNDEQNNDDGNDNDDDEDQEDSDESSDDTSDDEEENQSKSKKGRILKAFEDSDDENTPVGNELVVDVAPEVTNNEPKNDARGSHNVEDSQGYDVLPLAQTQKSNSEDLFASQASIVLPSPYPSTNGDKNKFSDKDNSDLGTQTFSILNINTTERTNADDILNLPDKLDVICETQPIDDAALDDVVGMCSGKFTQTQNVISEESQLTESQCPIGDDILELCTGKFYDNQFVTQTKVNDNEKIKVNAIVEPEKPASKQTEEEKDLLDSILMEMEHPVNEEPKTRKYVFDNANENEAVSFEVVNQVRKKFVIDSDDESTTAPNLGKKKKLKKRKREKRALQISDDEEDEEQTVSDEEVADYTSDVEDDGVERIVEYDSEENEIEVKPQEQKKKRKMAEFFEQEAELTSEDEWVGSGDEDEAGLDRMEREAGDDDTFHEGQLQRELGQIHMRDVLDQDKREVRLIQELLFEDGDLGEGHRQRKFRWKNLDGEEETGPMPNIFGDSQEEEFESEEQWRKQRHEREVFLRNLQKENETEDQNISIDRTTIIKANLCSKTMSSLLLEVNGTKTEETIAEKKTAKEEPCPAMPLPVFQQSYHGSLLTRGRGALARLAALAMPLAGEADDDAKVGTIGPSSKRNFVFTSVTPNAKPKVAKRKADENVNVGTPRLIKKLKTDDKKKFTKSSLLDHLKAL